MGAFKEPHGGVLNELYLSEHKADEEKQRALDFPAWDLTARQMCDLDMLMNGGFSPLDGFMGQADYESVCDSMRLTSGVLWPIPINLDVSEEFAETISVGDEISLCDPEGVPLATLSISDKWQPDRGSEAERVYGTSDESHPGVAYLLNRTNGVYLGGAIRGLEPPTYYDFKLFRDSPQELRARFRKLGWRKVVAFHTSSPMHRAQQELTWKAAREVGANLLIHPVAGTDGKGEVDHFVRVHCYEHALDEYPEQTTQLSLLNIDMRMAGPREALWHGIVRKNYGCTHFIVGRHHADCGDSNGQYFYEPYAAQELFREHEAELDIALVPCSYMVYAENRAEFIPTEKVAAEDKIVEISAAEFHRRLREGLEVPSWFSFPKVIGELRKAFPPKHKQGFTVFFTGLSGSGKSTVANALMIKLKERGVRPVSLLDGDVVRKNLSSELNFSKEHRDLNILRIGYVASEISKNGGIAICAPIAPYKQTRRKVREMITSVGGFIEIHISTPIEVCESRDRKGLYAKARAGLLKGFTGIDDPYETPENADMAINTDELTPDLAAHRVLIQLESLGYIR